MDLSTNKTETVSSTTNRDFEDDLVRYSTPRRDYFEFISSWVSQFAQYLSRLPYEKRLEKCKILKTSQIHQTGDKLYAIAIAFQTPAFNGVKASSLGKVIRQFYPSKRQMNYARLRINDETQSPKSGTKRVTMVPYYLIPPATWMLLVESLRHVF